MTGRYEILYIKAKSKAKSKFNSKSCSIFSSMNNYFLVRARDRTNIIYDLVHTR